MNIEHRQERNTLRAQMGVCYKLLQGLLAGLPVSIVIPGIGVDGEISAVTEAALARAEDLLADMPIRPRRRDRLERYIIDVLQISRMLDEDEIAPMKWKLKNARYALERLTGLDESLWDII